MNINYLNDIINSKNCVMRLTSKHSIFAMNFKMIKYEK